MVTTHAGDNREGKEGVLYVAACSVEDPLVPVSILFSRSCVTVLIKLQMIVEWGNKNDSPFEWLRNPISTQSSSFRTASASPIRQS